LPKPERREGTPDSPSRSTTPNSATTYASNLARQASSARSSLFDRLNAAVNERGQMLGNLEESFNSLQQGSQNMVNQAKRMAAEQSGRRWLGM
jgi:syntaxin-binding protein 5